MFLLAWFVMAAVASSSSSSSLTLNFEFSGSGSSSDGSLAYKFENNSGFVNWNGETYGAMCYYSQEMGSYRDYPRNLLARWINFVGVRSDGADLIVGYIDCDPQDLREPIGALWLESFTETLFSLSPGSGDCSGFVDLTNKTRPFPVKLPSLTAPLPPNPQAVTGIEISGPGVSFLGSHGWIQLPQQLGNWSTTLLSKVDCYNCISNCLECHPGPWYELHFIANSPGQRNVVMFGIFYLFPKNPNFVQLNYTITLPSLQTPSINYDANWHGKF